MTDSERTDDSGRLQIPFPPDDPEAPASGTASGRSRLSDRRPSDPDAGPATGWGQRAARLTGARHRPGHTVGRGGPGSSFGSGAADGEPDSTRDSDLSDETGVAPSNGTMDAPPVSGPGEAGPEDRGGARRAPRRRHQPVEAVGGDTPVETAEPGPESDAAESGPSFGPVGAASDHGSDPSGLGVDEDGPAPRFRGAGAWGAVVADRLKQIRLPKPTRKSDEAGPDDTAASGDLPAGAVAMGVESSGAISSPATEPAPSRLRRPLRRPDMGGLEDMRARPKSGRIPDWMARRIAEFEAPGAAYELGKQRRWRRRKITVLRSRTDRRLVRRIDTWTVFKVSFMFYLLMVIIVLIAGIATWNVAEHLGFIGDIQKSVRSLADDKSFVFHGDDALRWAAIGGAALGLLGTLFNTVAAMLYNLLSDVVGGLQVIVVTEAD